MNAWGSWLAFTGLVFYTTLTGRILFAIFFKAASVAAVVYGGGVMVASPVVCAVLATIGAIAIGALLFVKAAEAL